VVSLQSRGTGSDCATGLPINALITTIHRALKCPRPRITNIAPILSRNTERFLIQIGGCRHDTDKLAVIREIIHHSLNFDQPFGLVVRFSIDARRPIKTTLIRRVSGKMNVFCMYKMALLTACFSLATSCFS
jgi:hypothetical protein